MYKDTTAKLKKIVKADKEESPDISNDRIMLRLAQIVLCIITPVLGFLLTGYIGAMHKAMDSMAASIARISDTQESLAIMLARVDTNVRNVDERLDRIENKKP